MLLSWCFLIFFICIFALATTDNNCRIYIIINFTGIILYIILQGLIMIHEKANPNVYHQTIFFVFFPMYYLFVVYNFLFHKGKTLLGGYVYFPEKHYVYFSFVFNMALIMFMIGCDSLKYRKTKILKDINLTNNGFLITGFILLIFFSINIKMMNVTFWEFIGDRMIRNYESKVSLGGLSTTGIFALFSYYLFRNYLSLKSNQRKIYWIAYILWVSVNLLRGERRLFLIFFVLNLIIYNIRINKISKRKLILSILPLYIILIFLGFYRHYNHLPLQQSYEYISQEISLDKFILSGNDELNFPTQSFFYIYAYEKNKLRLGKTYVNAFLINIPRIITKQKPIRPANEYMKNYHYYSFIKGRGYAYSPVTEAFQNFGIWGIPIVFFTLGVLFSTLRRYTSTNPTLFFVYLFLCVELINFIRIDFAIVISETLYFLIPIFLTNGIHLLLSRKQDPKNYLRGYGE
ncbi:O-antigen polysaccharide polymerase Wzy [Clostridiaceae bacterium 35-E11]